MRRSGALPGRVPRPPGSGAPQPLGSCVYRRRWAGRRPTRPPAHEGGFMLPWSAELSGRIDEQTITSELLKDNPLGDPSERPLWVYLPPGYDDEPDRRYPSVYVIQGMTGQLDMWRNRFPFRKNFPELTDELFAGGDCPPCIVAYEIGRASCRERV